MRNADYIDLSVGNQPFEGLVPRNMNEDYMVGKKKGATDCLEVLDLGKMIDAVNGDTPTPPTPPTPQGGAGWITEIEDKQYDSIEDAEELNMADIKGALFSYNAETGKYTVWNGAADEAERPWDYKLDCSSHYNPGAGSPAIPSWDAEVEFPTNEYGEVIAVCAGKGLWVSTKWASGTSRKWCEQSSPLYAYQFDCGDLSGAEVAKKLYAEGKDLTGSIFADVKAFQAVAGDGTVGHHFLPSRSEIFQVVCACADENHEAGDGSNHYTYTNAYYNATHIIALSSVWSSSQYVYYSDNAYYLGYGTTLNLDTKDHECTSAVCLRFGNALA